MPRHRQPPVDPAVQAARNNLPAAVTVLRETARKFANDKARLTRAWHSAIDTWKQSLDETPFGTWASREINAASLVSCMENEFASHMLQNPATRDARLAARLRREIADALGLSNVWLLVVFIGIGAFKSKRSLAALKEWATLAQASTVQELYPYLCKARWSRLFGDGAVKDNPAWGDKRARDRKFEPKDFRTARRLHLGEQPCETRNEDGDSESQADDNGDAEPETPETGRGASSGQNIEREDSIGVDQPSSTLTTRRRIYSNIEAVGTSSKRRLVVLENRETSRQEEDATSMEVEMPSIIQDDGHSVRSEEEDSRSLSIMSQLHGDTEHNQSPRAVREGDSALHQPKLGESSDAPLSHDAWPALLDQGVRHQLLSLDVWSSNCSSLLVTTVLEMIVSSGLTRRTFDAAKLSQALTKTERATARMFFEGPDITIYMVLGLELGYRVCARLNIPTKTAEVFDPLANESSADASCSRASPVNSQAGLLLQDFVERYLPAGVDHWPEWTLASATCTRLSPSSSPAHHTIFALAAVFFLACGRSLPEHFDAEYWHNIFVCLITRTRIPPPPPLDESFPPLEPVPKVPANLQDYMDMVSYVDRVANLAAGAFEAREHSAQILAAQSQELVTMVRSLVADAHFLESRLEAQIKKALDIQNQLHQSRHGLVTNSPNKPDAVNTGMSLFQEDADLLGLAAKGLAAKDKALTRWLNCSRDSRARFAALGLDDFAAEVTAIASQYRSMIDRIWSHSTSSSPPSPA